MAYLDSYASQDDDRNPRLRRIFLGGLAALILILLALASDHEKVRPARSDDSISAWVFSQEFVNRRLASPSAAEFCGYNPDEVFRMTSDTWKVSCWVDERTASGDAHRTDFISVLHKNGDLWSLQRLTFPAP